MDEKEKMATAYHEAGHAVVQYLEKDCDPIHKVTVIPRGRALRATMTLPEKDRYNYSKKWCTAFIKVTFGGRIAEEMFTGDMNSGVMGDIRQATGIARKMITEWGMNDRLVSWFTARTKTRPTSSTSAAAKNTPRKPQSSSTRKSRNSSIGFTTKLRKFSPPTVIA